MYVNHLEKIGRNSIKEIQLKLLKRFIEACQKGEIDYYLAYGTLLGAVRHKGYIPWDDDIDVLVKRSDVEKLIDVCKQANICIINSSIDKKYFSPLIKIYDSSTVLIQEYGQVEGKNIGVYIDVFVLDNVPDDDLKRKKFYHRAEKLRFYWSLSCRSFRKKGSTLLKTIAGFLASIPFRLIGYKHFSKKYESFVSSISVSSRKGIVLYGEGFEKEFAYSTCDLEKEKLLFEGIEASVPKAYKKVLEKCYGDYMTLPPVQDRKVHKFNAYYLEKQS